MAYFTDFERDMIVRVKLTDRDKRILKQIVARKPKISTSLITSQMSVHL